MVTINSKDVESKYVTFTPDNRSMYASVFPPDGRTPIIDKYEITILSVTTIVLSNKSTGDTLRYVVEYKFKNPRP